MVLVDGQAPVRARLRSLLDAMPGIQVVGEAGDGQEALARIAQLRPDLVLIESTLLDATGVEVAASAKARYPGMRVIPMSPPADEAANIGPRLARLTPRQRQILGLIAEGYSTREIAHQLGRSVKTVETHRGLLMRRLGARNVPALVKFAIRAGLVPIDG